MKKILMFPAFAFSILALSLFSVSDAYATTLDQTGCQSIPGSWDGATQTCNVTGTVNFHGTLDVPSGTTLQVSTQFGFIFNYGTITNNGAINLVNQGGLAIINGGVLNNNSVLNNNAPYLQNGAGTINNNLGATINNNGAFTNYFSTINNKGTINTGNNLQNQAGGVINNDCTGVINGSIIGTPAKNTCLTPTTTTLSSAPTTSIFGQSITFTATVSPSIPDGNSVAFYDGATQIGTGSTSGSVSTFSTFTLATGSHTITAKYLGDVNHASSASSVNTVTVNQLICPVGSFLPSGAFACVPAPPGSFVNTTGATSATQCPAGQYQPQAGQTQCLLAPAGSYAVGIGNTQATQCPAGTYSDVAGSSSCTSAPAGSFVGITGATSATQCPAGKYQPSIGQVSCIDSPAGSYATGTGNTQATQCPLGQFQPNVGQTSCINSPAGSFVGITGATSATQCPAGTFSDSSGANQCTNAAPGTFATGPGATHTEFCQIGSYQPNSGQSSCLLADTGYFVSTTAATSEQQCPAGTYSDSLGQAACTPAPAGTYATGPGATQATQCSPGYYQPQTGQTSCLQSDPGFFVAISGAISEEPCQLGFTSQAGASQCTPLPPTAFDDTASTDEDTSVTTDVLGNDANLFDTPVSVTIESPSTKGIATVNGDNTVTYTPSLNSNGQDSYQYRVTDASGDSAIATVTITVNPVNDAPTISEITPITSPEITPITFDASASDVDSPTLTFSLVGEPAGASMSSSGAFTWTPTELQGPGTYNFQVKVTDSFFDVFTDVSITVTEVNQAPTASAGDDQTVNENTTVSLSGAASDADIPVQTLTYLWTQTSGSPVVLSDDSIASPTFTAPQVGLSGDTLTFSLVVSDGQTSTSDTVSVTVNNVDTVSPEAYNQFDPVTRNVLVYGTDDSDGNLGPITPSSITKTKWHTKYDDENGHGYDEDSDDEHDGEHDQNRGHTSKTNAELRTYTITDHSGNTMKLTEIVKQKGNEIKVKVLSIQYGNNPTISPKLATKHFEWSLNKNGSIKELEQKMTIGKGKTKQETSAKYDSKKNETKIESENPKSKETLPGMVLLKMGTNQGSLIISH